MTKPFSRDNETHGDLKKNSNQAIHGDFERSNDLKEKEEKALEKQSSEKDQMCLQCGGTPCYWLQHYDEVMEDVNNNPEQHSSKSDNSARRKRAGRRYNYHRHGILGKGRRIRLQHCVVAAIRASYPDTNDRCTGFKEQ
ncbi:hypothetical protein BWQ96_03569 [Gracilariopsis chorda]|uniref:Uncharacterized protein n=1 Tax=Gracilariopsis chorda TaxID=448386 RepID=A0A2V3IZP5_9FLOR|nr:hypothetical protein BWQ96_03569 [Gracilariopsis chorda]|eukprot:PXF46580.1 hypothetical protein BWQ96_03569 [Gracilariopsis chorda]